MLGCTATGATSQQSPPHCRTKRERSLSLESTVTEQVFNVLDPSAVEAAELLFSLRVAKRGCTATDSERHEGDHAPQIDERSSSSCGSACSARATQERAATSPARLPVPLGTRTYVWRGPKRSLRASSPANACPGHAHSSDPDDEDQSATAGPGVAAGTAAAADASGLPAAAAARVGGGSGERADRDKEWAALTTWLRMNLHHPRTAKREVLFVGKHVEDRGWNFFLNPALTWDDVSPETKMRLRTLPQETELAFSRKYPGKTERDWVKKSQKYRPPGCSVTYAVPLAEMIYSLTAIYYRFEGRPGTGASAAAAAAARPGAPGQSAW